MQLCSTSFISVYLHQLRSRLIMSACTVHAFKLDIQEGIACAMHKPIQGIHSHRNQGLISIA